jgi:hypothetical protein
MAEGAPSDEGFSWKGDLEQTSLRSIYAACRDVRFTGHLFLVDGEAHVEMHFLGGEPVEANDAATHPVSLWERGKFHVVQRIPDLDGELTDGIELDGSLAEAKPASLLGWIDEYRLSCEMQLVHAHTTARLSFQAGRAERAELDGAPELSAIARVSSWSTGSFRVRLRPLFVNHTLPLEPRAEAAKGAGDPFTFDLSSTVSVATGKPSTPWLGAHDSNVYTPSAHDEHPPEPAPSYVKPTPVSAPAPPPQAIQPAAPAPVSHAPWIALAVVVGVLVVVAVVGALYALRLPPFSPSLPPK